MEGQLVKALFKSSLIAGTVFAAVWFRIPPSEIIRNFILYGILITIISLVLGLPLAWLIERLKIGRWWSHLAFAAATGALLGGILSSHPTVESRASYPRKRRTGNERRKSLRYNLFAMDEIATGIRWRDPPIQWSDFGGTIAFGAVIGGVLGFPFGFSIDTFRKRLNLLSCVSANARACLRLHANPD
jgi:hypothetical protein